MYCWCLLFHVLSCLCWVFFKYVKYTKPKTRGVRSLRCPDLEDVFSRCDVSDVDPLTVDVGAVSIIATRTQTLSDPNTHTPLDWIFTWLFFFYFFLPYLKIFRFLPSGVIVLCFNWSLINAKAQFSFHLRVEPCAITIQRHAKLG